MGTFIIALCALVALALFVLAFWAVRHPVSDPEEAEWMNDIK